MVVTAVAVAVTRNLFTSALLTGIYSLFSASFFVLMDAVDVAFTEAAVGAGIATLLMLATLTMTGHEEKPGGQHPVLATLVVLVTGTLLIIGTLDMPAFGAADTPVQQHVTPHYIDQAMAETGVPNVVTAVLASYRGFDTLGETVVIFTAGLGVLLLLGVSRNHPRSTDAGLEPMAMLWRSHRVPRVIGKNLIPPIMIFALYVQFHGDYGPGGGFQAGVIFAAAVILYSLLFGAEQACRAINLGVVRLCAVLGVLLYGSVGIACMLGGGNFLDYDMLADDAVAGQHLGILLIELGVGITVASVMILIFLAFALRPGMPEREQS
jgi:multicomponent Na+:H+ antiporter subunit B